MKRGVYHPFSDLGAILVLESRHTTEPEEVSDGAEYVALWSASIQREKPRLRARPLSLDLFGTQVERNCFNIAFLILLPYGWHGDLLLCSRLQEHKIERSHSRHTETGPH